MKNVKTVNPGRISVLQASNKSGASDSPWWKEPLMWLVLGLPASVVAAGIYTIILASRSGLS